MWKSLSPRLPTKLCHWLQGCGWEVVDLTRYITDLASSDFPLAGLLKVPVWQEIWKRLLFEAICHLLATKTQHIFLHLWGTRRGAMVGNVCMSLVTVEVWCVPCAIYSSMSEYISRHQTVYLTYWTPLCLPYVISIQEYTRPVDMNIHLEACSYPLFIMIASDTLNHSLKFHRLFLYNIQMKQGSVGLYCLVWNWILAI